jgi:transposase
VTKPFSLAYKQKMVEKLTGKEALSARQLARDTGISQETLSRWRRDALSLPLVPTDKRKPRKWTIDEKARILVEASKHTGDQLTVFLEREGVLLAELEHWRLALEEEGRASIATTKRIHKLERELARKEKALAEAAALLVLKKKLTAFYGEDEDDDTDEGNEK